MMIIQNLLFRKATCKTHEYILNHMIYDINCLFESVEIKKVMREPTDAFLRLLLAPLQSSSSLRWKQKSLRMAQFSEKISNNILVLTFSNLSLPSPNFFKPSLHEAYASSELLRNCSFSSEVKVKIILVIFSFFFFTFICTFCSSSEVNRKKVQIILVILCFSFVGAFVLTLVNVSHDLQVNNDALW